MSVFASARRMGREAITKGVTEWRALAADWRRIEAAYRGLAQKAGPMLIGSAYRAGEQHAKGRAEAAETVADALVQVRDSAFGALPLVPLAVIAVAGYTLSDWDDVAQRFIAWRREADAYAGRVAELQQLNRALDATDDPVERKELAETIVNRSGTPPTPSDDDDDGVHWGWWLLLVAVLTAAGVGVHHLVTR